MISDDKRREVSRLLREEFGRVQCQWPGLFRDMLIEILECDGTLNGASLYDQMAEKLADLIDRPTCSMSDIGDDTEQIYRCSACGEEYCMSDIKPYPWRFCPNCGARVIDTDD